MEVHLKIIGVLLMTLASIHIFFPKYFNWKEELKALTLINRQMMTVHTFFIAFVVFLIGLLCLTSATDLTQTKLGKTISLGLGIFWATRLIFQLFVYSTKLWKGKTFETTIHIVFTILWIYLTSVFLWTGLN
ncbi:hypothetical protein KFZ70_15100 [Tamlana fucoidanivorans]|uniref:Uncharacterized protein n=1 Tax=Allotamlana fucoidanivorans TaxID=2583814 RepID=A0A5C4SDY9_9FLAO|nr:hypothetical protein [Tamlana fucoidanivorans]TNJ41201.1 hypothetical protein FGF67_16410 [Tamlana fucoidanivorans]